MFSKYDYHTRFNSQHNSGNLHDHLMSTKLFTLISNEICMRSEGSDYGLELDLLLMSR